MQAGDPVGFLFDRLMINFISLWTRVLQMCRASISSEGMNAKSRHLLQNPRISKNYGITVRIFVVITYRTVKVRPLLILSDGEVVVQGDITLLRHVVHIGRKLWRQLDPFYDRIRAKACKKVNIIVTKSAFSAKVFRVY